MNFPLFRILSAVLPATIAACTAALGAEDAVTVRIDTAQRFQTLRGFGASGAWWTNYVADFPEAERT